jgi:RimJ/RimL family protein N-acetyltransferase
MGGDMIEASDQIGEWVAAHGLGRYAPETSRALGLRRNGKIVAGAIYQDWNGQSVVLHIAIAGKLTPAFLGAMADYTFNVCNVEKAIAPVSSDNLNIINLIEKVGFIEEARVINATPGGDLLYFTLHRDNCRFLGERYAKRTKSASAA